MEGKVLEVPQFIPPVHLSNKQFGLSFARGTPQVWNESPKDIRSVTSLLSFWKKMKTYLFPSAYPP